MSEARIEPTAERWTEIENALKSPSGSVQLQCDGYILDLKVAPVATRRFEIGFYVNGWKKSVWLRSDCEERRRFCRAMVSFVYPQKLRAKYGRSKINTLDWQRKVTSYWLSWPSFAPLRRHLLKNNHDVRIIKINGIDIAQ